MQEETIMGKKRKIGMARLWELALRKKLLVYSSCTLSVLSVAVSFIPFIAIYYIIREIVFNFADLSALNGAYLMDLGYLAAGGAIVAVLLNFFALMCSHVAAFTTLYDLKMEFVSHIASLPLGFFNANSSGKLRKITDENIEKIEGFIAHQLPDLVGSFAMPCFTLIILFIFDWRLGLASLVPLLIAYIVQMTAFGQKNAKVFIKKYQDSLEDMNNAAVEYVRGISVVKVFNQTIFSFREFYNAIKTYGKFCLDYTISFEKYMILFMLIIQQVYLFIIPVIILLSGAVVNYAEFALSCIFYLIFSVAVAAPFTKLMYVSHLGKQIADGVERMDKILDVRSLPQASLPQTAGDYNIAFENVNFSYNEENENAALINISFEAEQGAITALVGPSGGGKSTIAHLIPRFYDVASGAVKIGGVDIREMSAEYLMSIVSFVFQDVFLFKQSVAYNIGIGNKDASREQIIAAATAAQCREFVEKLPYGYDTVIETENIHLSGGERQRIVIARAILKNAPILILDEATAFADSENERKIYLAFEELIKDKTVIIIAHRLSTVRGADRIIVIDKGKVAETGKHEALIKAGGRYAKMWDNYNNATNWSFSEEGSVNVQTQ
jgi:ATP-binding cassette subfamily B protein